jgi:hypothetical protein
MEESDERLEEPKEEEELDASYEYNASGERIGVRLGGDLHLYVREEDRPTEARADSSAFTPARTGAKRSRSACRFIAIGHE